MTIKEDSFYLTEPSLVIDKYGNLSYPEWMGIYIVELLCENASEHHPWIKAPLYKGTLHLFGMLKTCSHNW